MPSEWPYSGMSWDDLESRMEKIMRDFVREIVLIDEELHHRKVPAARLLHERVKRIRDFFVRGSYGS